MYDHSRDDELLKKELDTELNKHIQRESDLFKAQQIAQNSSIQNINDKFKTYKITIAKESLRSYLIENKIIDSLKKGF
jgi:hypothetical protein